MCRPPNSDDVRVLEACGFGFALLRCEKKEGCAGYCRVEGMFRNEIKSVLYSAEEVLADERLFGGEIEVSPKMCVFWGEVFGK